MRFQWGVCQGRYSLASLNRCTGIDICLWFPKCGKPTHVPQGVSKATFFQSTLTRLLNGLKCKIWVDDVFFHGNSPEELFETLDETFTRLESVGLFSAAQYRKVFSCTMMCEFLRITGTSPTFSSLRHVYRRYSRPLLSVWITAEHFFLSIHTRLIISRESEIFGAIFFVVDFKSRLHRFKRWQQGMLRSIPMMHSYQLKSCGCSAAECSGSGEKLSAEYQLFSIFCRQHRVRYQGFVSDYHR